MSRTVHILIPTILEQPHSPPSQASRIVRPSLDPTVLSLFLVCRSMDKVSNIFPSPPFHNNHTIWNSLWGLMCDCGIFVCTLIPKAWNGHLIDCLMCVALDLLWSSSRVFHFGFGNKRHTSLSFVSIVFLWVLFLGFLDKLPACETCVFLFQS